MILPQSLLQDLRYGVRMLYRNAGFTTVAVVALALGIGINTSTFTAYKAMIARPIDARDPNEMVNIALMRHSGVTDPMFSYSDYEAYRDHLHSFAGLIAESHEHELMTLSGVAGTIGSRSYDAGSVLGRLGLLASSASNAELAGTFTVSENYFSVLGVTALRGRTFNARDSSERTSPSVLISENYWQKRFARDPALLDKTIRLNGVAFNVVGITPRDFTGTSVAVPDFWLPLSAVALVHATDHSRYDREDQCCRLFARLAPGTSIDQAQAEMTLLANNLRILHDPLSELSKSTEAKLWPGSPFPRKLDGGLMFAIVLVMIAVGMVLVIACASVTSLQLARAASRQSELCMRLSLGAGRSRLVQQLLTESVLLGLLAGGLALFFTWALLRVSAKVIAEAIPAEYGTLIFHVAPDLCVFAYSFVLSLVAGILFGLAPALDSSRSALATALKTNAGTSSVRSRRLRNFLIGAQVAVSVVIMIAGGMLIRTSTHLLKMDTGYDSQHVVDLDLQFPAGETYGTDKKVAVANEVRTRLSALPGVTAITTACSPYDCGVFRTAIVSLNGEKPSTDNTRATLYYTYVQANYFQTLGIPLLLGRCFQSQAGQPEASVILSESAAKKLWREDNPLGRSLRLGTNQQSHSKGEVVPDGPTYQVIGIARDIRGIMLDGSDSDQVYVPLPEDHVQDYPMLIRSVSAPKELMELMGPEISDIDPNLVARASILEETRHLTTPFAISSLVAAIASMIGLVGLLLASMGIYGTVNYAVVLRTREIGIRMALGAKKRDILGLIFRQSMGPVFAGLFVGACLAAGASYLLRGVLYGLRTVDGISVISVSLLFLAIALLAAYLPSRRAMRVDPMVTLRRE